MTQTLDAAPPLRRDRFDVLRFGLDNVVWALIIIFSLVTGLFNSFFLTTANLQNVLVQATSLGVLVLAVSFALLVGEIDLSVTGNLAFSGMVGAMLIQHLHIPGVLAILAVVGTGTVIGLLNGVFVAMLRMNSLITTLAMGLFLQGAVLGLTKARTLVIDDTAFTYLGSATVGGWPLMPVALLLAYVAAAVALRRTQWGRNLYATGGSAGASLVAGIPVRRVRLSAFVAAGTLGGLGGFLSASYLGGVNVTVGNSLLLYAVAAPVIGGVSLTGGRGRIAGMLGGALLISVIQVGLQLINLSAYYIQMIGGAMILVAIAVDAVRVRRTE
ncbi:ABC transporter permease [Spirillospora sp. CA-142024]|uniref:ABC transporter permease n=1 Tax=Spirillospora sp. CA-142024 TaxID=3240036 RepID=UPI003D947E21